MFLIEYPCRGAAILRRCKPIQKSSPERGQKHPSPLYWADAHFKKRSIEGGQTAKDQSFKA
ncbi:hypothetical protein [Rubrivivax rivuli]|uniref:Uncharacterized protein n=1 Tax=Rubrivivax rivuli TaxID=1862385 RepID=A0A437RM54_9BURK|nr:hypothetical protein [Rubrivivax rivuli]RVU47655.1 hypothetical protein EOE66_07960 [Rubrivivax rivuli]